MVPAPSDATRTRLLEVAGPLFAARGFRDTGIEIRSRPAGASVVTASSARSAWARIWRAWVKKSWPASVSAMWRLLRAKSRRPTRSSSAPSHRLAVALGMRSSRAAAVIESAAASRSSRRRSRRRMSSKSLMAAL